MKANEAPKKIYLYPYSTDRIYEVETKSLEGTIEYVRYDAFIEKAVQFIKDYFQFEDPSWYKNGKPFVKDKAIERFINYMKGE